MHSVQVHYLESPTSNYLQASVCCCPQVSAVAHLPGICPATGARCSQHCRLLLLAGKPACISPPPQRPLQSAVEAAIAIHKEDSPGDILIFLTGQDECEAGGAVLGWLARPPAGSATRQPRSAAAMQGTGSGWRPCSRPLSCSTHAASLTTQLRPTCPPLGPAAVKLLEEEGRRLQRSRLKWRLQPVALYAGLPATHQLAVFEPAARGMRKARGPSSCAGVWLHYLPACLLRASCCG